MSRPDYQKRIEARIASFPEGSTFITSDFLDIADTQVVNKALSRMTETGSIRRILRDNALFTTCVSAISRDRKSVV